jgi:HD-GYP domain-containing protein (c-di-GMP phosphodiesterase class II)
MVAVCATALLLFAATVIAGSPADETASLSWWASVAFWLALALIASLFPVQTPRGSVVSVTIAPILACAFANGPIGAAIVAAVGTLEPREIRGEVPWYGTIYNHASSVIPAIVSGVLYWRLLGADGHLGSVAGLIAAVVSGAVYIAVVEVLAAIVVSLRQRRALAAVLRTDLASYGPALAGLVSVSWLMALAFESVGALVAVLVALPLYTTRASYASVVEIRKMFTQTVRALASAIDARDPSTKKHSEHVSTIAVEIGQVLGLGEADIEQLEWAGLLHDIGKIGIADAVLLKPDRLNRQEREEMNRHPQRGWSILTPVERLRRERELVLHHHQWWNGSGYPRVNDDGEPVDPTDTEFYDKARPLVAREIPRLARILHVADAFEAMTASRPYRPVPMSAWQALAELRKYSGIQFDPEVVDAFEKTASARGDSDFQLRRDDVATDIPQIGELARKRARAAVSASVSVDPR